jgi:hypothetical protein
MIRRVEQAECACACLVLPDRTGHDAMCSRLNFFGRALVLERRRQAVESLQSHFTSGPLSVQVVSSAFCLLLLATGAPCYLPASSLASVGSAIQQRLAASTNHLRPAPSDDPSCNSRLTLPNPTFTLPRPNTKMPAPPKQRKMAIVGSRAVGEFALPIFTCKRPGQYS